MYVCVGCLLFVCGMMSLPRVFGILFLSVESSSACGRSVVDDCTKRVFGGVEVD